MQYLISFLFALSSLFFSTDSRAADLSKKSNSRIVGYRIIRTSPEEFKSAIWMMESNTRGIGENKSRLTGLFSIKNKIVRQDFVSFELQPNVILFKQTYDLNERALFTVTQKTIHEQNYELSVVAQMIDGNKVFGHIIVSKHELGSLLVFYLDKSSYGEFTTNFFIRSFHLIRIMANDPESATIQTLKELK